MVFTYHVSLLVASDPSLQIDSGLLIVHKVTVAAIANGVTRVEIPIIPINIKNRAFIEEKIRNYYQS